MFINSLPIRVSFRPDQSLGDWLRDLQERNAALRQYEWTPLSDIQRWSDVPNGTPLLGAWSCSKVIRRLRTAVSSRR